MTYCSRIPTLRMRSMWDSIYAHTTPVDGVARRVVGMEPFWRDDNKKLTVADCLNVTRSAPGNMKDRRGLRSKFHLVIGFADRVQRVRLRRQRKARSDDIDTRFYGKTSAARQALGKKLVMEYEYDAYVYVLCVDGSIERIGTQRMEDKLRNMDAAWIENLVEHHSQADLLVHLRALKPDAQLPLAKVAH